MATKSSNETKSHNVKALVTLKQSDGGLIKNIVTGIVGNKHLVLELVSAELDPNPESSKIFLDGVLEAGKKAKELLLSKGIRTGPTPSKSSKVAAVGETSAGVKPTAPKFKERPNPIKAKKRLKSDYEKARERQKFLINRKKQKRDDEALLGIVVTD
ncbi:hypothetical protein MTR_2g067130 [Medicago truncatula]|uniref:Uncharacterized protein n=1 Tax=Medicago truncatula TaxID=3880 RepID=A0A072VJG0_MEDTR|nr:hypothetical protein MTR_2g067130 [Medicago truncatula]